MIVSRYAWAGALVMLPNVCLWAGSSLGGSPLTTKSTHPASGAEQTITLPDRDDQGTGSARIDIPPGALARADRIPFDTTAFVPAEGPRIYALAIRISTRQVTIELRRPPDANPVFVGAFSSTEAFDPRRRPELERRHTLEVEFANWKVSSVKMDGKLLSQAKQ